jgi:CheY-like chemotaxis protein
LDSQYVLVVDDDPNVRLLVQDALAVFDIPARAVKGGTDALEMVRQDPPRAIVLDLMMPVMDGFSVLAHLQREATSRRIPIIVLSALIDQTPQIERLPGVVGAMCKGAFSMEEFHKLLVKAGIGVSDSGPS